MTESEVPIPSTVELTAAEAHIESVALDLGLAVRLKGSLAKFDGCIHWHFGMRGRSGTLEVTLWPAHRRCWISIHSGRRADWVYDRANELRTRLLDAFCDGQRRDGFREPNGV